MRSDLDDVEIKHEISSPGAEEQGGCRAERVIMRGGAMVSPALDELDG